MFEHLKNSLKDFKDVIIPNFVNYMTKESSSFYIIYNTINKIKEIFNIKRIIDPSEEKLRISFEHWLDIVSRKIERNRIFDGDLIVIIEGAHLIFDKNLENNIKFWLPKYFPKRVRFIITLDEDSYNLDYFKNQGCPILQMNQSEKSIESTLSIFEKREFLLDPSYVSKMFITLKKTIQNIKGVSNFFIEVFICSFIPYFEGGVNDLDEEVVKIIQ